MNMGGGTGRGVRASRLKTVADDSGTSVYRVLGVGLASECGQISPSRRHPCS
jgi:hypothetical protein